MHICKSSDTTLVKDSRLVNLFLIEHPRFQSIQESGEYDSLVNCILCFKINTCFISKMMMKFSKSTCSFSYLVERVERKTRQKEESEREREREKREGKLTGKRDREKVQREGTVTDRQTNRDRVRVWKRVWNETLKTRETESDVHTHTHTHTNQCNWA